MLFPADGSSLRGTSSSATPTSWLVLDLAHILIGFCWKPAYSVIALPTLVEISPTMATFKVFATAGTWPNLATAVRALKKTNAFETS